jgi:RNA polymerase sigma-70 factor, ECF subfamily
VTDQDIIHGFLNGSASEHDHIVGWIRAVVNTRLWDGRVHADDVIADTRMKLLVNLRDGSFRLESSLKTYVQRITLYTLVDASRRARPLVPIDPATPAPDQTDPHAQLVQVEEQRLLARTIALLPDGCRNLVQMTLQRRMTCREVAAQLGISEGAVKTRLSRCRDRIRELVRQMM